MIEIDFLPVGEKTDTGDAILCHFTDPGTATDRVMLIDGGFNETSAAIAAHVKQYYSTSRIDLMICTHPDEDHINGLFGVFEELEVTQLVIHQPSSHGYTSDDVKADKVDELINLARSYGTEVITTAYAGHSFFSGSLVIAGPSEEFYKELLAGEEAPAMKANRLLKALTAAAKAVRNALSPRSSDPGEGELTDNNGTTPRNNSSIILDLTIDGYRALFTGDAGAPALTRAADYLDSASRSLSVPDFFDIPHHGSRHSLTTDIMNRLAGPIVGDTQERTAFVSVGKEADEYPRAEVANAFKRRGYEVGATRGQHIMWGRGAAERPTWGRLEPLTWLEPDD